MLRVLQVIPSISLVYGGPSQMVLGLSAALAAAGVQVTILTTDANGDFGQPPLDVPLDRPVAQDGYQIRYFRCSPFRRYKFSLALLRWLAAHSQDFDLAHIHALFSPISTAVAMVARSHQLPYLVRPLGTLDPADLRKKRQLKQLYTFLLERRTLAGAAAIHFTSAQEARVSERFGLMTRDLVVPLGVNLAGNTASSDVSPSIGVSSGVGTEVRAADAIALDRASFDVPDDCPLVLFMSRIDPKKGLDLLLPALNQLQAEGVPFHFVLAGSNPQDPDYEKQIQQQLQALPLAERTTVTGFVSGERKRALLHAADLFVLPSYYENFGIAVAEAMVAGIPVAISNQVYIWEDVQQAEAGWVCYCGMDSLSEVLRSALQNDDERKRRGQQGRQYALKHYCWDAIAQQMIRSYQQVLSAGERS